MNCATFQAADELRRVQRIAYRTVQLRRHAVIQTSVASGGLGGLPRRFQPLANSSSGL